MSQPYSQVIRSCRSAQLHLYLLCTNVGRHHFHHGKTMDRNHKKYWAHWPDRILLALEGCILGVAAAVVICCFRLCMDTASPRIMAWLSGWKERWWTALVWMLVLIAAARFLGWLVSRVPLISGSGIPQTELVVLGKLHLSRHEWLKILD